MRNAHVAAWVSVVILLLGAGSASASLQVVGTATYGGSDYKLIYDTDDLLTWLDYSSPATGAFPGSLAWAASLNDPGTLTVNLDPGYSASWGASEWRLPEADGYWNNQSSNGITGSEMQGLYYDELGNELNDPSINHGDFENLVSGSASASFYYMEPTFVMSDSYAPEFNFHNGTQGFVTSSVNAGIYGLAVRSGEVVPEPATVCLLGSGLIGLIGLARRRRP